MEPGSTVQRLYSARVQPWRWYCSGRTIKFVNFLTHLFLRIWIILHSRTSSTTKTFKKRCYPSRQIQSFQWPVLWGCQGWRAPSCATDLWSTYGRACLPVAKATASVREYSYSTYMLNLTEYIFSIKLVYPSKKLDLFIALHFNFLPISSYASQRFGLLRRKRTRLVVNLERAGM